MFLFYFNRLFGTVVSFALRTFTWYYYRIYIDIQAVQVSVLGGRIFFKGFRYHGRNETILVTDGYIAWKYWLRRVREADAVRCRTHNGRAGREPHAAAHRHDAGEAGPEGTAKELPCRIAVKLRGLEWVVYNRGPAYDAIESMIAGKIKRANQDEKTGPSVAKDVESPSLPGSVDNPPQSDEKHRSDGRHAPGSTERSPANDGNRDMVDPQMDLPSFLNFLPIRIECTKGAMTMGNENTTTLLVARFKAGEGLIDAREAGPADLFRQCFDFDFEQLVVDVKPNADFKEKQLSTGARLCNPSYDEQQTAKQVPRFLRLRRTRKAVLQDLYRLVPSLRKSVESATGFHMHDLKDEHHATGKSDGHVDRKWLGLPRYLDDDTDGRLEQERWKAIEYAQVNTLLECTVVSMSFFWDVPGPVVNQTALGRDAIETSANDHSKSDEPIWGLDIRLGRSTVYYSPWADRQRAELQTVFFPSTFMDSTPTEPPKSGQSRVSTRFNVSIILNEQVVLRLFTREESKDWRWRDQLAKFTEFEHHPQRKHFGRGKKSSKKNADIRPPGWLDLTVSANSSISYTMDMVARTAGFRNCLELDLKSPSLTSSVNHDLLWKSRSLLVSCDLSNPLRWNDLREWMFTVGGEGLELFLLRDHIFLLTDLVNDWTSESTANFLTFVPFQYLLKLRFMDFKAFLNVNELNIINRPTAVDDNTFIILKSNPVAAEVVIPMCTYQPLKNEINFNGTADSIFLDLNMPSWKTQHSFLDRKQVASLETLKLKGSYEYCTSTSAALTDTLVMDVMGDKPILHLHGYLVRYFLLLESNYFGKDKHFQTLEEYQQRISDSEEHVDSPEHPSHVRPTNDLDVILSVEAQEGGLMMPALLYSADEHIGIDIPHLALDLRFTNYYMDLAVSLSPLTFCLGNLEGVGASQKSVRGSPQLQLDGLSISGHRLFGLPPAEPTYVCNWDFDVDSVTGECSLNFLSTFVAASRAFAFGFTDTENALQVQDLPLLHDVTFLRAKVKPVVLWIIVDGSAFFVSIDSLRAEFNDWAGSRFSEIASLIVPNLTLACISQSSIPRGPTNSTVDKESCAYLTTTLDLRMVESKARFAEERQLQQDHVALHDSRTRRTPWLLHELETTATLSAADQKAKTRPPAMPYPPMPEPLHAFDGWLDDSRSQGSWSGKDSIAMTRRPSSFLSSRTYEKEDKESVSPRQSRYSQVPRNDLGYDTSTLSSTSSSKERTGANHSTDQTTLRDSPSKPSPVLKFPLTRVRPKARNLPILDEQIPPLGENQDDYEVPGEAPGHAVSTTFMVSFGQGVRAFFTTEALLYLDQAISSSRPLTLGRVLDDLQLTSLEAIISASKLAARAKVTQIRVDLPAAAIRFHHPADGSGEAQAMHESIDLKLYNMKLNTRLSSGVPAESPSHHIEPLMIQGAIRGLHVSLAESTDVGLNSLARVEIVLEDILAWLVKDNKVTAQIQFHRLGVSCVHQTIQHLAHLIANTITLSEVLVEQFSKTRQVGKSLLQSIVHFLAVTHQTAPDPSCLTQASYVLRAASLHPRGSDEWKMICRLRSVASLVTDQEYQELYSGGEARYRPQELQIQDIIRSFNAWRSWDLSNVRKSHLLKHVYNHSYDRPNSSITSDPPLNVCLNAGDVEFVVAPGPQESKILLAQLVVAAQSEHTKSARAREQNHFVKESVLQVACGLMAIQLNWDLCELARDIISHLGRTQSSKTPAPQSAGEQGAPQASQDIHFVVAIERTEIRLQTINLSAMSDVQNLALSTISKYDPPQDSAFIATITANYIRSNLASTVRKLVTSELRQPIIHAAVLRRPSSAGLRQSMRGGTFCDQLVLDIGEDMLGVLGAVDRVLADEVSYVQEFVSSLSSETSTLTVSSQQRPKKAFDRHEFSVVLLMKSYCISTTLMSSLKYVIKGDGARSSVEARSGEKIRADTNFDLKEQKHVFQNLSGQTVVQLSKFSVPPFSGRLALGSQEMKNRVNIFVSIGKILMDASSIHALVSTLSRREVSNFWQNVVRDAQLVSSNYNSVVGKAERPPRTGDGTPKGMLLYHARIATAGLHVTATAGGSSCLILELNGIHSDIHNQDLNGGQPLIFPEIHMSLASFNIQLQQSNNNGLQHCGDFAFAASLVGTSKLNEDGQLVRSFEAKVDDFEINLYAETASIIVDVLGYLQNRFKNFSLSEEINTFRVRRRRTRSQAIRFSASERGDDEDDMPTVIFNSMYSIEMSGVQISWRVGDMTAISPGHEVEDLVFSIGKIDLATKKENVARLLLKELQLQMVPTSQTSRIRSRNSALMPEVVFNVAYLSNSKERRLAFLAVGKSVDLRLTSQFVVPANDLQRSIGLATRDLRAVLAEWNKSFVQDDDHNKKILGNKRLSSVLVDVDFAGAVVYLQSNRASKSQPAMLAAQGRKLSYQSELPSRPLEETANTTTLRTPGIAVKVEFKHIGDNDPALNAEMSVKASSNTLQPSIVPLVLELSSSVRELVEDQQTEGPQFVDSKESSTRFTEEQLLQVTDPSAILGNCSLNVGLRICKQEFGLSCQPIAKVAAAAEFESIYITVNTVQSAEQNRFFAVSGLVSKLGASVQHAYSRDSTGKFLADSITLSLMNSRHVSHLKGISTILRFSPMSLFVNARQLNDFLLFREIWLPSEMKGPIPSTATLAESHASLSVQRYQRVAAVGGFPWNATISFQTLDVQADLGQSLGKASFTISNLWLSSKKQSDWEQNLCIGFDTIALSSIGRASCSLELRNLRLRTSIQWPEANQTATPLVQASLGFDDVHAKAAFEYQAFFVADLSSLDMLMFNVRGDQHSGSQRLVCIVNSDRVQTFITTQSAAQAYSVYQAIQRVIQEKQTAYENAIREIERYYRRRSSRVSQATGLSASHAELSPAPSSPTGPAIQLQTNVVVSLRAINVGAYPKTFYDSSIFKLEALDASAAFSVRRERDGAVASRLGLQLGQVRIALSTVPRPVPSQPFEEMAVSTIVLQSTGSRGGTILKVPRLVATMRTRQADARATHVEYGFRSAFEGRVEVGWNINRVNYIRTMWETHSRALNQRLGRNLTQSRVQITGVPRLDVGGAGGDPARRDGETAGGAASEGEKAAGAGAGGEKITAVVNVPQSRYTYTALEPPIIETPQLRDMGEATPPLEWIGLHRDRLPNITHQIVIVPLLEVAREVEDAYARILGT